MTAAEYGSDPVLHQFYRRILLRRGWAGTISAGERAYQRHHASWVISTAGNRPPWLENLDPGAFPDETGTQIGLLDSAAPDGAES